MSNNFQDSLECKICYDNFDEHEHRYILLFNTNFNILFINFKFIIRSIDSRL